MLKYDLDSSRIATWGVSAGGWIVSMLGVTADTVEFIEEGRSYPEQSDAVQAVVDWCDPFAILPHLLRMFMLEFRPF